MGHSWDAQVSPKGSTADSAAGSYTVTCPLLKSKTPWQREQSQPHKVTMDTMCSLMAPKSCFRFFVCSFSLVGVFPNTSWRLAQKHGLDWMLFAFAEPPPESDRAGVPGSRPGRLWTTVPGDPLGSLPARPWGHHICSLHPRPSESQDHGRGCGLHRGGNKTCTHIYFT